MNTLKLLAHWLRSSCADLARSARTLWRRLSHDPEYAQAAAQLVVCATRFWCLTFCGQTQRLARIIATLAVPWLGMIRSRDGDDPNWQLDPGWA